MIAEEKVPHIIFSAGLGDVIEVAFTKFLGKPLEKLHIVSNMMEFDNKVLIETGDEILYFLGRLCCLLQAFDPFL